jgi:hypothetical protein
MMIARMPQLLSDVGGRSPASVTFAGTAASRKRLLRSAFGTRR